MISGGGGGLRKMFLNNLFFFQRSEFSQSFMEVIGPLRTVGLVDTDWRDLWRGEVALTPMSGVVL